MGLPEGLAVAGPDGGYLHNPTGAAPGFTDVLRCLFGAERPGDGTTMTLLENTCLNRDVAFPLELASDLAMQCLLVGSPSGGSRPPAPGPVEKRALNVQGIRLDQHPLQVELAQQLFQHRPLVVLTGGVAGMGDRHTQGGRIQRHLGNERRTTASGGLDRTPQCLANRCAEAQGLHKSVGPVPLHHLGSGRSSSRGWPRTGPLRPPAGRSSGTPNPMGAAAVQDPAAHRAPNGGAERTAPDLASFRSRSGSRVPPPAADTRPECGPHAACGHPGSPAGN